MSTAGDDNGLEGHSGDFSDSKKFKALESNIQSVANLLGYQEGTLDGLRLHALDEPSCRYIYKSNSNSSKDPETGIKPPNKKVGTEFYEALPFFHPVFIVVRAW